MSMKQSILRRIVLTILLGLAGFALSAQNHRIEGLVMDETNQPVPGAAILVKGTANLGTSTDLDGHFTLVASGNAELLVTCIGYMDESVQVNGRDKITVVLKEDNLQITETVVVGYGTQKKVNLSGAVSSVKMDEVLGDRPQPNVAAALQGAIPGLYISSGSNTPGQTGKSIQVRGSASFSGSTTGSSSLSPLVLIDNVPGDIDALNPDDIESISVLKDASASAIYGARAAAGVILITTKSPKRAQKVSISYSGSAAVVNAIDTPKQVDLPTYIGVYKEAFNTDTYGAGQSQNLDKWLEYYNTYKTNPSALKSLGTLLDNGVFIPDADGLLYYMEEKDQYKRMMETGSAYNHNISASGATDKIRFRFSGNRYDENGPLAGRKDVYSRTGINAFVSADIRSWFTQEVNVFYTKQKREMVVDESGILFGQRNINYVPDGIYVLAGDDHDYYFYTPYNALQFSKTAATNIDQPRVFTKSILRPLEGLEMVFEYTYSKSGTNYNYDSGKYYCYSLQGSILSGPKNDYSIARNFFEERNSINAYATYKKDWGRHHFSVMGGFNQEYWNYAYFNTRAEDQAFIDNPSMSNAQGKVTTSDQYYDYALRSGFARLNYNYDGRYIVELSGRYDGSSKFPKKSRFGFFPSFSVAWNAANESFLKDTDWVSTLKPRFSYGSIGNQASVGYYDYYSTMALNTKGTTWLSTADDGYVTTLGMPGIVSDSFTWETITTTDVGLDFTLFKGALYGSFDWYRRDTKDILSQSVNLPAVLGETAPLQNVGSMHTNGWELQIGHKGGIGKDFSYSVGFNISDYRSFVDHINFNEDKSLSYLYEGKELGEIWGYEWDGFYTKDDFEDLATFTLKDGVAGIQGVSPRPGDFKYKNLRDGQVNDDDKNMINTGKNTVDCPGDRKVIGNSMPRYQYGINLSAGYKGFGLSVMLQGIGKRDFASVTPYNYTLNASDPCWFPVLVGTTDYWSPKSTDSSSPDFYEAANPNATLPRIYGSAQASLANASSNRYYNDHMLLKASYLRVKNITLSYTIPHRILEKVSIDDVRLYVSCENLLTFSNLPKGIDPETLGWSYPLYRTVSFGLNVTL